MRLESKSPSCGVKKLVSRSGWECAGNRTPALPAPVRWTARDRSVLRSPGGSTRRTCSRRLRRTAPSPRHHRSVAVAPRSGQRPHPRVRARTLGTDSRDPLLDVNEARFHVRLHRYQPRDCSLSLAQDSSAAPARPRRQKRPTQSGSPAGPPQSTPRFRARRPARR